MVDDSNPRDRLRALAAADDDPPLGETALLLAALDHPNREIVIYRKHMDEIAHALSAARENTAEGRADALSALLHVEYGYEGDRENYDHKSNADLMEVIDRRKGLPVALAILYIEAARRVGWQAWGLDFPGHFIIRVDGDADRVIVDPFHGGVTVEPPTLRQMLKTYVDPEAELGPEHYEPMSDRAILLRLLNNIRGRAISAGDQDRGLEIMDRMLLIASKDARLWVEAGALRAKAGLLRGARQAIESALSLDMAPAERQQAEYLLQHLRKDLN